MQSLKEAMEKVVDNALQEQIIKLREKVKHNEDVLLSTQTRVFNTEIDVSKLNRKINDLEKINQILIGITIILIIGAFWLKL